MDVIEADGSGHSRLDTPGCSLDASWQELPDADGGTVACFACRVTLSGEAGPVIFVVPSCAPTVSQAVQVAEIRQAITVLPGQFHLTVASPVRGGSYLRPA